jgi:hypothetical protein
MRKVGLGTSAPGCFDGESAGSKLVAQSQGIKQPDAVDFMASSVSLTDAAKNLYVSDEASLILVLCCLDQYGPIVARTPSPVSERRFSKSNNIEDKYAAQR